MHTIFLALFAILGAIIGSFLNVIILRYNTGRTVLGRSGCATCGAALQPKELIPIVSFFLLHGRCATCKSKISPQYPIVEGVTAITFFLIGLALFSEPVTQDRLILACYEGIIAALLIVISAYDIRHKIIPNAFVYTFIGISALSLLGFPPGLEGFSLSRLYTGIGLALFPTILWLVSRGRWMGLGDAKILLGTGFLLGPTLGVSALLYAFWLGALFSLSLLSKRGKEFTMKSEIPFGPFIVLGMALAYFFNLDFFLFLL